MLPGPHSAFGLSHPPHPLPGETHHPTALKQTPSSIQLVHHLGAHHILSWYDLPSFLSCLCLSPAPSPSPSDSIQPCPPALRCLRSNSEVYSCNYAMSMLRLALD